MGARSYLYVPGDRERMLARAGARGADAVILDLEDAVAAGAKPAARTIVAAALADPGFAPGCEVWVRVNATELATDITAVVGPRLTGVLVAKAEPALLVEADRLLGEAERRLGLDPGSLAVIPLIESARGVLAAPEVARSPRVVRLAIGEADLAGELNLAPGPDGAEFAPIRMQLVVASAAAGIDPPIGPVQTAIDDPELLAASTRALLASGFRARSAIHPGQVATINEVFTPSAEEVARARRMLAAMGPGGDGVAVDEDGGMLDPAVLRSAYEILSRVRPE